VDKNTDNELYVLQIRKLAASCQQGESYVTVKAQIRAIVESFRERLGKNPERQVNGWSVLFESLGGYLNNNSAPEWVSVIYYARKIINLKKHTATCCLKRQRGQKTDEMLRING